MAATRHGSRWLHEQPSEEDVREWFTKQTLHDGMEHSPYLGGIVLIGATEKVKQTFQKANGEMYVKDTEQAVFVPYVKVDTRIAYFWDYVRHLNGGDILGQFVGVIEPVPQRRWVDPGSGYFNAHLPEGFGVLPIKNSNDTVSRFLVAQYRVAIYERQSYASRIRGEKPMPILSGIGTKQTGMARNWADDNAVMKAETGAIGRALGVAGILVVGTGVATAEDMQEAQAGPAGPAASAGEGATLPEGDPAAPIGPDVPGEDAAAQDPGSAVPQTPQEVDEALRERATALKSELESDFPEAWAAYLEWWRGRFGDAGLTTLTGPALNGAVVKLERDLDAAKQART